MTHWLLGRRFMLNRDGATIVFEVTHVSATTVFFWSSAWDKHQKSRSAPRQRFTDECMRRVFVNVDGSTIRRSPKTTFRDAPGREETRT